MLQHIDLCDRNGRRVATADVEERGQDMIGSVNLELMPTELSNLFARFETAVNEQLLSEVDELETEIERAELVARFQDGRAWSVVDLQVFPRVGQLSFRLPFASPLSDRTADARPERDAVTAS